MSGVRKQVPGVDEPLRSMAGLRRPGRRSFERTPIDRTRIHGATALLAALATGLLSAPNAVAQTSPTIEQITAEANARSAAGMPDVEVEAWIDQAMEQAGLTVRKPPESWDVYGQARWERELLQDAADTGQAPQLQAASPAPRQHSGAGSDSTPAASPADGPGSADSGTQGGPEVAMEPTAEGRGEERSGRHAQEQGGPATTYYVYQQGLGTSPPVRLSAPAQDAGAAEAEKVSERSRSTD